MHSFTKTSTVWAAAAVALIAGASTLSSHVISSVPAAAPAAASAVAGLARASAAPAMRTTTSAAAAVAGATAAAKTSAAAAVAAVAAATQAMPPAIRIAAPAAAAAVAKATSEQELHAKIRWVPVRRGGERTRTLDEASRLMLAQAAAERANLDEVGLSFQDVYGLIDAETSWIPRSGMGRNGVASHGLAQFEPRTARGLGLEDPDDPVQAVYAAALYMKHGAEWAADRIDHLKLTPEQYAAKIREGVSVYYNLSVRGRNKWNGVNTGQLPVETQRHIRNVRAGAVKAADLADDLLG